MIMHDGGSALNQKVGMVKGIAAHREVEFVMTLNFTHNSNSKYSDLVLPVTTQWERGGIAARQSQPSHLGAANYRPYL
jgi:anaerobic dimethyl sulfoxide reductase subunit A